MAAKGREARRGGKAKAAAKKARKRAIKPAHNSAAPRAESEGAKIMALIQRLKGATLGELMNATEWQAHSARGFISSAAKKHGVKYKAPGSIFTPPLTATAEITRLLIAIGDPVDAGVESFSGNGNWKKLLDAREPTRKSVHHDHPFISRPVVGDEVGAFAFAQTAFLDV